MYESVWRLRGIAGVRESLALTVMAYFPKSSFETIWLNGWKRRIAIHEQLMCRMIRCGSVGTSIENVGRRTSGSPLSQVSSWSLG